MPNAITDWGQALVASLATAMGMLFAAVPRIIGFLIILAIGWFIASLIGTAVAALLRKVRFNDLAARAGISDFVQKMEVQTDASGIMAAVVKWFFRLIALVVAFDALGLPAVSDVLRQLLLWLPNLVVALVVLVIGGILANFVSNLVRGAVAEGEVGTPNLFAAIARYAVWAFAVIIAVNQIGVAQTIVNTLFMGVVATLVLALGLSFGLGARDTAGEIVRNWYARMRGRTMIRTPQASPGVQAAPGAMAGTRLAGGAGGRPGTPPEDEGTP